MAGAPDPLTAAVPLRVFRIAIGLLIASAAAMALRCATVLSGDTALHLVLMESSAAGHWFELNPGLPEPLTSSVLWTGVGALLWRLGGVAATVIGLKLLGLCAWLSMAGLAWGLARRLGAARDTALLAAVLSAALPGTVENSLCGMENGLFGALVLGLGWAALGPLWRGDFGWRTLWPLTPLATLAVLARPEGLPVVGLLGVVLLCAAWKSSPAERWGSMGRVAIVVGAGLALAAPPLWAYARATGQWFPQSALSRAMRARRDPLAFSLAGLWLHPRALVRLAAYAPLVALGALTVRGAFASRRVETLLATWIAAGALLYSLVGAVHTARYLIWNFALLGVLAALGLQCVPPTRRFLASLALVWVALAATGECVARFATQSFVPSVAEVIRSVPDRAKRTGELVSAICSHGCCHGAEPLAVAAVEIQSRFTLDGRVRVYSTEGLSRNPGEQQPRFADDGCPDLTALLADPHLVAWLDDPSEATVGCPIPSEITAIQGAWSDGESASPGWVYDPIGAVIRVCPK